MRIDIKSRNASVNDKLRRHIEERFTSRIGKQVSELARLEVELMEERNPAIPNPKVAEATLHLKGAILRSREASSDFMHSVDLAADKLARQVKRHREKRRGRRDGVSIRVPPPASPEAG